MPFSEDHCVLTMKLPLPYTSERRFLLIQYLHSHGLLLLRSIAETDKSYLAAHASQPLSTETGSLF